MEIIGGKVGFIVRLGLSSGKSDMTYLSITGIHILVVTQQARLPVVC